MSGNDEKSSPTDMSFWEREFTHIDSMPDEFNGEHDNAQVDAQGLSSGPLPLWTTSTPSSGQGLSCLGGEIDTAHTDAIHAPLERDTRYFQQPDDELREMFETHARATSHTRRQPGPASQDLPAGYQAQGFAMNNVAPQMYTTSSNFFHGNIDPRLTNFEIEASAKKYASQQHIEPVGPEAFSEYAVLPDQAPSSGIPESSLVQPGLESTAFGPAYSGQEHLTSANFNSSMSHGLPTDILPAPLQVYQQQVFADGLLDSPQYDGPSERNADDQFPALRSYNSVSGNLRISTENNLQTDYGTQNTLSADSHQIDYGLQNMLFDREMQFYASQQPQALPQPPPPLFPSSDMRPPALPSGETAPSKSHSSISTAREHPRSKRKLSTRDWSPGSTADGTSARRGQQCVGCTKFFQKLTRERCQRCHAKWQKHEDAKHPPRYDFDPTIETFEHAHNIVYPVMRPLDYTGTDPDDWENFEHHDRYWIQKFIQAATKEYTEETRTAKHNEDGDRVHENLLNQQKIYNHKPYENSSQDEYRSDRMSARWWFLFQQVLRYHRGGQTLYPIGGANNGYGDDKKLKMSERMDKIIEMLEYDKRVVTDVIEGRGVAAMVANPTKYEERKNSNNKCNTNKKAKLQKARDMENNKAKESGSVEPPAAATSTGQKRKRKGDDDGPVAGPSKARAVSGRVTRQSTRESIAGAVDMPDHSVPDGSYDPSVPSFQSLEGSRSNGSEGFSGGHAPNLMENRPNLENNPSTAHLGGLPSFSATGTQWGLGAQATQCSDCLMAPPGSVCRNCVMKGNDDALKNR